MTTTQNEPEERLRILILDDEPIVCKRLKPALAKFGYQTETFTDSTSALARLEEVDFDVVITDLKMEGPDGMHILEAAQKSPRNTQVIIITGFATVDTAKESYRKGAVEFIAKPFKLGEIIASIQRIEEERQNKLS